MDAKGLRALICVLVVGCSVAVVGVPAAGDPANQRAALQADSEDELTLEDADQIAIDVFIRENGSAEVTVDYQFHRYDENTSEAAWERLRDDVESNTDDYASDERTKWNGTIADGANETDRNMTLSSLSIETENESAPREIGHVTVTFDWTSFALVEINRIEAGAALAGFTLTDDMALRFRWPEPYSVYENDGEPQVEPSPTDRPDDSVTWQGEETEFSADQPRIVLIKDGETTAEPTPSTEGPTMPWAIVVLALALLATVGVAGWLVGRRRSSVETTDAGPERTDRSGDATEVEPNVADGPPPELLSNEERVLRLLEERGGRIKQQEVVSELGWTEAKTSQVVGDLRENDEIEVFRIGRENVLALPEE